MIKKLGTGNHGQVYAVDIAKKLKALKTNKEIIKSLGFDNINELDITLRLRHPYINQLLDFRINKGSYIFLYPIASGTLEKIEGKPNSLKYINQLLIGLNYIHHRDIINADIKPENILYFSDVDIVKYNDFGSSIINDIVFKNKFTGTLGFSAPETLLNNKIVKKSDVWSLGLSILFVLYQLEPQKRAIKFFIEPFEQYKPDDILRNLRKYNDNYLSNLSYQITEALKTVKDEIIKSLLKNMLRIKYKERKSVEELLKLEIFNEFRADNEEILKFYPGCNIRLEYLTYYNIKEQYDNAYNIFNLCKNYFKESIRIMWSIFNGIDIFNELITKKQLETEKISYFAISSVIVSLKLSSYFNNSIYEKIYNSVEINEEIYEKTEYSLLKAINYKVYRKNIYSYLLKNHKDKINIEKLFNFVTSINFEGELSEFVSKYLSIE